MKLETIPPGREWDDFASQYTDLIFFRSLWAEVLRTGIGAEPRYYCLVDGGRIVGGMPAVTFRLLNLRFFYSSIPYGGYIGEAGCRTHFYTELMKALTASPARPDVAYFTPAPFDSEQPRDERLQQKMTPITYIDVGGRSLTDVEGAFQRGVMQSVRKSRKYELRFEVSEDRRSFDVAYALYRETMKRNRAIVRYRGDWFQAVYDCLVKPGLANICTVFYGDTPVASVIPVYSGTGLHLLNNGSSTHHLPLRANDYMIYEIIKNTIARKLRYVDLMNSEPDDHKLIAWKEKFGSVTIRKWNATLVNSRVKKFCWDTAKKIYPLLTRNPFSSRT